MRSHRHRCNYETQRSPRFDRVEWETGDEYQRITVGRQLHIFFARVGYAK